MFTYQWAGYLAGQKFKLLLAPRWCVNFKWTSFGRGSKNVLTHKHSCLPKFSQCLPWSLWCAVTIWKGGNEGIVITAALPNPYTLTHNTFPDISLWVTFLFHYIKLPGLPLLRNDKHSSCTKSKQWNDRNRWFICIFLKCWFTLNFCAFCCSSYEYLQVGNSILLINIGNASTVPGI